MGLDIGKAFTFLTDDPKWVTKVLIGGGLALAFLISFITIVGWIPIGLILTGYFIQLTRNVVNGEPQPLPEWDNWGERIVDGFKGWLVSFVYSLPAALVSIVFSVPAIISSIRDSANGTTGSGTSAAASAFSGVGGCLSFILGIIVGLVVPIAVGRYAATSDLGQAFQVGEVFATLRRHFVTYLVIALLSSIVLQLVAGIGLVAICIGAAFTWFYSQLVLYYLYGQAHRQATGAVMQPNYGQPYGQRPF